MPPSLSRRVNSRGVDPADTSSQLARHDGGLPDAPAHGAPDAALFQFQEAADGAAARRAHFLAHQSWMFAVEHEAGRAAHGLGGHELGLGARQAHSHGSVGEGLHEEREEGRAGAAQRGGDVHHRGWEGDGAADAGEDPVGEGLVVFWEGWVGGGDDGHGFADQRGRVGHDAHDLAGLVLGFLLLCQIGVVGAIERLADLVDGHAGADGDQQLARESLFDAWLVEQVLDHVGLAAEDDHVSCLHALEVVVLQHGD